LRPTPAIKRSIYIEHMLEITYISSFAIVIAEFGFPPYIESLSVKQNTIYEGTAVSWNYYKSNFIMPVTVAKQSKA
jgi:hypothetical protein